MKAVLFQKTGSLENIEVSEIASPRPIQTEEVRIKFLAGGLNHLDLWVVKGLPRIKYKFPHISGADICGEVIETKTTKFKIGDRVIVCPAEYGNDEIKIRGENIPGVFSEEIVTHSKFIRKIPEHLTPEEGAALPLVYLTAWQMLTGKARLQPNSPSQKRILVHGAGSGVTQALLSLLVSFGEKNIVTTSRDPEKLEHWKKNGVATFKNDPHLEANLKTWLSSNRFDLILDHVGAEIFEMNIRLLRNGGTFVTCGATSGPEAKLDLRHLYFRQLEILGSTMGTLSHFTEVLDWIERSRMRPKISKIFNFSDAQEAYRYLNSGQQDGKVIIRL
jgi:NADPH:quinone reductase-like Zn-dependent oxidoreductase